MANNLFVYGTLVDREIQRKVLGRKIAGVSDALVGYEKTEIKIDGEVFPAIMRNKDTRVLGVVISVTDDELEKIDKYETEVYERREIALESGKSSFVYVRAMDE